ncbi:MAG TPA: hypothetical protein VFF29_01090, partial [Bacteroidota bacterium]|nr:hypothetical protein [Bacteroidota bacterium]
NLNTVTPQLAFNSSDTRMLNLKSHYPKSTIDTGKLVEHSSFGKGRVLSVSGKGDSQKVVVEFIDMGKKDLLLKYANLKVI